MREHVTWGWGNPPISVELLSDAVELLSDAVEWTPQISVELLSDADLLRFARISWLRIQGGHISRLK